MNFVSLIYPTSWAKFGAWEVKNIKCFDDICAHMLRQCATETKEQALYYGTCEMWTWVIMTGYRQRRKPPSFLSIMVSVSGSASRGFVRCVIPFPTFVLKSTSQLDYVRFVPFSLASSFSSQTRFSPFPSLFFFFFWIPKKLGEFIEHLVDLGPRRIFFSIFLFNFSEIAIKILVCLVY